MPFTSTPITVKDSASADKSIIAYNDGTSSAFAHPLLDNTGAIINPATSANQATTNTKLDSIIAALENTRSPRLISATSTLTRPADTTAYANGDLVANSTTAGSVTALTIPVARANDIPCVINSVILRSNNNSVSNPPSFRVWLFSANPVASAPAAGDNGALNPAAAANASFIGAVDVTMSFVCGANISGVGMVTAGTSNLIATPASGTQNIFALIQFIGSAYTPISGQTFDLALGVVG